MKLIQLPDHVKLGPRLAGVSDDFFDFNTGDMWTSLAADTTATVAASDAANGVLVLTTDATDNNEAAVKTTKKVFLFAEDKPHFFEARVQYAEANTDDANVFVGFSSVIGANMMVDNGAGPATSFSGAGFFKIDGGTNWNVVVSLGATQTKVELTAANSLAKVAATAGGSAQQVLRVEFMPQSSTKAEVKFFIDDVLVYKFSEWVFTSAAAMFAGAYNKAGGANSEVLNVDRIDAYKLR